MNIDLNQNIPYCPNFRWREFLLLRKWDVYAVPETEEIYYNIIKVATVLQRIRDLVQVPVRVTSAYRPTIYNELIGGAPRSQHRIGAAVDFKISGFNGVSGCNRVREILRPYMDQWEFRIENIQGGWVHIDLKYAKDGANFFNP